MLLFWIVDNQVVIYCSFSTGSIWHSWPLCSLSSCWASSFVMGNFSSLTPRFSNSTFPQVSQMSCITILPILLKANPYDIFRLFCYPTMLRILEKIPFLFFFSLFSTNLKHSEQRARRLTGLLSFGEPLMCSNCGGERGLNLTLHFWHRLCARSSTVCRIASVRCSYFFLSKLGLLGGPKKDTHAITPSSNLFLAITQEPFIH